MVARHAEGLPMAERSPNPIRIGRCPLWTFPILGPNPTQFRRPPDGADILLERSRRLQETPRYDPCGTYSGWTGSKVNAKVVYRQSRVGRQAVPRDQTPRGLPPAKTCWRMHSDPSAYRSSWRDQDRGACAMRGRALLVPHGCVLEDSVGLRNRAPAKDRMVDQRGSMTYRLVWPARTMARVPDAGAPGPPPHQ